MVLSGYRYGDAFGLATASVIIYDAKLAPSQNKIKKNVLHLY